VVAGRLANAIQPDIIRKINTRPIALLEMENIGFYLKACWKLGVASAELFVTSDLYLRKGEPQVVNSSYITFFYFYEAHVVVDDDGDDDDWQVFVNLLSLARIADSTTSYKGPTMKSLGFKVSNSLAHTTHRRTRTAAHHRTRTTAQMD
jgi:hypothetical protein